MHLFDYLKNLFFAKSLDKSEIMLQPKDRSVIVDKVPAAVLLGKRDTLVSGETPNGNIPIALTRDICLHFQLVPFDETINGIRLRLGTYCRSNHCHVTVQINDFQHRFEAWNLLDNEFVNIPFIQVIACVPGEPLNITIFSEDAREDAVIAVWCSKLLPTFVKTVSFAPLTLPNIVQPRVSIVIPVFNKVVYTYNCLLTLQNCDKTVNKEVIIVNNASSDETVQLLAQLQGAFKVIHNTENQGFVQACRQGAERATGEFIIFLNNDTQVTSGWIASMLQVMDANPQIGIIGSKLIYPDGRLQEAGGIIFNDASGWNYGRFQSPEDPQYNQGRLVDYCSGASLMIRKSLWQTLGGFDMRYAPAYYEDTDLCFSARQAGFQVYYCHESEVIHHEGITAGTDTQSGYKAYQVINHRKFLEKWQDVLTTQHLPPPPLTAPEVAAHRLMVGTKGKII